MISVRWKSLLTAGVAPLALAVVAAPAGAEETAKLVTIAARSCPSYDVIPRQPRAQQHHGEPQGPGARHELRPAGEATHPSKKEDAPPQDACTPITDWRFTLGKGYQTRAVSGPGGAPYRRSPTPSDTPIRHEGVRPAAQQRRAGHGQSRSPGRSPITLTDAQAKLAATASSLWIQGGLPNDPVLNTAVPQHRTASGRCAARSTTSTATTSSGSPTPPGRGTCSATPTTSSLRPRAGRSSCASKSTRQPRSPAGTSASWATSRSTRTHRSRSPPRLPSPDPRRSTALAGRAGTSPKRCRPDGA